MADPKRRPKALRDLQETLNLKAARIKLQQRSQIHATNEAKQQQQEEQARCHYTRGLLVKAFNGWRRVSWNNEWTLTVRANYHYKYHLCIKVWKAWQVHVIRLRVKRARTSVAVMQANFATMKNHFATWKRFIKKRRLKRFREEAAKSLLQRKLTKHYFTLWRDRLDAIRRNKRMDRTASQHRSFSLTQKFFERWKDYVTYRRCKKLRQVDADRFYSTNLLRRCIYQGFLPYILHRRDRLQAKATASEVYMDHLARKSFHRWHRRLEVKRHIAEKQEQIENMGRRSRKRRLLNHWKYYVRLCYEDRQNSRIAILHHRRTLMRMTFNALHLRLVNQRLKALQQEDAHRLHRKQIIRHTWNRWAGRLDDREEQQISSDTQKARENFRIVLLRMSLAGWREYHEWRQSRQAQYRLAEAHYVCRLSRRTLAALGDNVSWQSMKRDYAELSQQFFREHTLAAAFSAWRESYHLHLDVRMMERMAILHDQKKSMQRAFRLWKGRTEDVLVQQENMVVASHHLHIHVCQQYFDQWRQFVHDTKESHTKEKMAERHKCMKVTHAAFASWSKYTHHRQAKATLRMKAEKHRQTVLCRKALHCWKVYHKGWQEKVHTVSVQCLRHEAECIRNAFQVWRANARLCSRERRAEDLAESHCRMNLLIRVLAAWHSYTLEHAVKAARKTEQITTAVQHLNRARLKQCFKTWRDRERESVRERTLTHSAKAHYARKALKKALVKWKDFRKLQTKKMLLEQQCAWLNSTRLQAKFFLQWRRQYASAQMEQSQTNVALWHWSLVLQGNVIAAWHWYMLERRRKKRRYEEAMNARHRRLLETGISNWLRTADELAQRRAKSLVENHAKGATRTFQLVRRYALLWRQRTLANRVREAEKHPTWIQEGSWLGGSTPQISHSSTRRRPKRPNFLRDSLQTAGLWESVDGVIATGSPQESNKPPDPNPSRGVTEEIPPNHAASTDQQLDPTLMVDTESKAGNSHDPPASPVLPPRPPVSHRQKKLLLPPSAFMAKPTETPQPWGSSRTHETQPLQPALGLLRPQVFLGWEQTSSRHKVQHPSKGARHEEVVAKSVDTNTETESVEGNTAVIGSHVRFGPSGCDRDVSSSTSGQSDHCGRLLGNGTHSCRDTGPMKSATKVGRDPSGHSDYTSTGMSNQEDISSRTETNASSLSVNAPMSRAIDLLGSVDGRGTGNASGSGHSVNGLREDPKLRATSDLATKVLRLKTLLLEYQQLKQQSVVLRDQRQVLMTILDDDSCDGGLQEEYHLVNNDIKKLSETSRSLKLEITTLMKETGIQD